MLHIEEKLSIPIKYDCDVLVAGGGFGGIAAAIAASREGKSVILAERGFILGGLATAGLVTAYLPLCDGLGHQVSFGLAEELLKLSIKEYCDGRGGVANWILSDDPSQRGKDFPRYRVSFNPQLFAILAEQRLSELGVKLLYGTTAVAAQTENGKISHVIFENKSGRFAIMSELTNPRERMRIRRMSRSPP